MELRKLIGFGKGSFVLSIPKPWIIKQGLKKGDTLALTDTDEGMLIRPDYQTQTTKKKSITIMLKGKKKEQAEAEITTAYLTNHDDLEILTDAKDNGVIREIIMNLAGLEILEQSSSRIHARYLLDAKEVSPEYLIRRIDNITRSIFHDNIDGIKGKGNYESIKQRDDDLNRVYYLLIRSVRGTMIRKHHLPGNMWELHSMLVLAKKIEKIADNQKRIARALEKIILSESFQKDMDKVYKDIQSSYIECMNAFFKKDKDVALQLEISNIERNNACDELLSKNLKEKIKKGAEAKALEKRLIISEIVFNMQISAAHIRRIARVILDRED